MSEIFTSPYFYFFYIVLMAVVFLIYYKKILQSYSRAQKDTEEIENELRKLREEQDISTRFAMYDDWMGQNATSIFLRDCVKPAWDNYYRKFLQLQQSGVAFTPDVYDFFTEEIFIHKFGKRKLAEIIPGIFLAFGIVGTFLGIAVGVSGLDPAGDAASMKYGIGILLSGMKAKFTSSIAGILLSAIWQVMDKHHFYPLLTDSFTRIRQEMDLTFPTQEESTVLYQMLNNQEKQILDFQSFLSDTMIPNMVSGFSDALNQSIMPHLEQTQSMMGEIVRNVNTNQMEGIHSMVDQFVSALSEITGDQMRGLGEALQTTIEWQQRVHSEMGALVESMQESARGQSLMVDKTTALAEQIHQYTDRITDYQTVLEKTVFQLNETTDKNSHLQSAISGLLDRMIEERTVFHQHFDEHLQKLQTNVGSIVSQTELQVELQTKFQHNLEQVNSLSETQNSLSDTLTKQAELSHKTNDELAVLLEKFGEHGILFTGLQSELKEVMTLMIRERQFMSEKMDGIYESLTSQLEQMDLRMDTLKQFWDSTSTVLDSANQQLAVSMNQFTDDMHRGLEHTFDQFDEELSKSVQYLSKGVNAIQEGIIDLPDAIHTLKQSVTELNKQAKNMTNIG